MTGQRFDPRAIQGDAAHDGYVLRTVGGVAVWLPAGVPTGGTAGQVLTKQSAADFDAIWSTPSGGGGSGSGKDRRWTAGASEVSIDEHNDDSLDAAWVQVNGTGAAAGNVSWVEGGDDLSCKRLAANTGNKFQAIVRPIGTAPATGDAWVTCMNLQAVSGSSYTMGGLIVCDGTTHGSGKQVLGEVLSGNNSGKLDTYSLATTLWDTANFSSLGTTKSTLHAAPMWVRLVYKGSNQWRFDFGPNGVNWRLGASLITLASFTPSHVGYYSRDGASGLESVVTYECIRRVAGVS